MVDFADFIKTTEGKIQLTILVVVVIILMTCTYKSLKSESFDPYSRRGYTSDPLIGITSGSSAGLISQRTDTGTENSSLSFAPGKSDYLYQEGMTGDRGNFDFNSPVGEADILDGGQPGIMYSPLYSPVTERNKQDVTLWAWDDAHRSAAVPATPVAATPVAVAPTPEAAASIAASGTPAVAPASPEGFYDPRYPWYPPNYEGKRHYLPSAGWSVTDDVLISRMEGR